MVEGRIRAEMLSEDSEVLMTRPSVILIHETSRRPYSEANEHGDEKHRECSVFGGLHWCLVGGCAWGAVPVHRFPSECTPSTAFTSG